VQQTDTNSPEFPLVRKKTIHVSERKGKPLSYDQITPELAAQIVKEYLLPMFDGKKKGSGISD
jgi:hypothetical protein